MQSIDIQQILNEIETNFGSIYERQKQQRIGQEDHPNRLPLKRRLADFRWGNIAPADFDNIFQRNTLAIERFRDITPAFVLAVLEDSVVFEPGDIGPISHNHPVAQDLFWAINHKTITPSLMSVLRDSGTPFYDGCLVIGIVDHRKQAFSSVNLSHSRVNVPSGGDPSGKNMAPEMRKILLKPSFGSILADIDDIIKTFPEGTPELAQDLEANILVAF